VSKLVEGGKSRFNPRAQGELKFFGEKKRKKEWFPRRKTIILGRGPSRVRKKRKKGGGFSCRPGGGTFL